MSDDQFTRLFKYMQKLEAKLDDTKAELKVDINRVHGLVDAVIKNLCPAAASRSSASLS